MMAWYERISKDSLWQTHISERRRSGCQRVRECQVQMLQLGENAIALQNAQMITRNFRHRFTASQRHRRLELLKQDPDSKLHTLLSLVLGRSVAVRFEEYQYLQRVPR